MGFKTACQAPRRRALLKSALVLGVVLAVLAVLIGFVSDERALDELKHQLDLTLIIALIVIINLISFLTGAILYGAYKWIRKDLARAAADRADDTGDSGE